MTCEENIFTHKKEDKVRNENNKMNNLWSKKNGRRTRQYKEYIRIKERNIVRIIKTQRLRWINNIVYNYTVLCIERKELRSKDQSEHRGGTDQGKNTKIKRCLM